MNSLRVRPGCWKSPAAAHGRRAAAQPAAARQHWRQQWQQLRVQRGARQPAASRDGSSSTMDTRDISHGSSIPCGPVSLALLAAVQPSGGGGSPPASLTVAGSAAFYTAMTALGAVLGDRSGLDVTSQLLSGPGDLSLPAAVAFGLPLGALCWWSVAAADSIQGFAELKAIYVRDIIPMLRRLPGWGLCVLAFGAGVGEETLFRAFLQSAAIQGFAGALPEGVATAAGLLATSVVFGALHALTPTYFWFATGAGLLFGAEYLTCGLQTAATTHWLYDWAALAYVLQQWREESSGGSSGSKAPRGPAADDADV